MSVCTTQLVNFLLTVLNELLSLTVIIVRNVISGTSYSPATNIGTIRVALA